MAIFTTLRGEIHNSIQHKLQNSMEVDSMGFIAILSMSFITTCIVKIHRQVSRIYYRIFKLYNVYNYVWLQENETRKFTHVGLASGKFCGTFIKFSLAMIPYASDVRTV